jgi:hypothetical protein
VYVRAGIVRGGRCNSIDLEMERNDAYVSEMQVSPSSVLATAGKVGNDMSLRGGSAAFSRFVVTFL